jgi:mannosyl-oligosaccharide alpha-1,2-mannosidase
MGGLSDSFYEYLLKRWLLTNGTVTKYRSMYEESVDAMSEQLLGRSQPSNLLYIGERKNGNLNPKMEHLACFVPGMLALGVMSDRNADPQSPRAPLLMAVAEELAATCWQMYKRSPSGAAPALGPLQ